MQRKDYFLKYRRRPFRNAIALIMAMSVIVVVATILALSISLSTQSSKKTIDLYVYEQAVLLSHSAAEYALLRISQDGPCSHTDDLNFNPSAPLNYFDINMSIGYVYTAPSPCTNAQTYTTVTTPEQNGSVLMDITVSVDDPSITSEPIRYFRRTIQKL